MKQKIAGFLNKFPYIKGIYRDLKNYEKWGIPGHFYSPIPNVEDALKYEYDQIENTNYYPIDLAESKQMEFVKSNLQHYHEFPFGTNKTENRLYFLENPNYSYSDAIFYYFIIRTYNPKKIIEVGSGYSSCLAIDINTIFYDNKMELTFVEPYPQLLLNLIGGAKNMITLHGEKVQETPLSVYQTLEENDVLFIDSSHVLKSGSDLNHILFNIIPHLKKGVIIHFHDIFNHFSYPKEWIQEHHRGWNEIYALRLFLMYNTSFEIIAFNNFLIHQNKDWFLENMPLCMKNYGGSIWLKKMV